MDWRAEAVGVLRSYHARKASLASMAMQRAGLESAQHTVSDPIHCIVMKAELARCCQETEQWVRSVDNALDSLGREERRLLTDLLICPKWGNLKQLQEETGYTRSTLYRKRDKALRSFTLAMYGRE